MSLLGNQFVLLLLSFIAGLITGILVTSLWMDKEKRKPYVEHVENDQLPGNVKLPPVSPRGIGEYNAQPNEMGEIHSTVSMILPAQPTEPSKGEMKVNEVKPPSSIVTQIDVHLQELLAVSSYSNLGIRLAEGPQHNVIVWIGLTRYDGIDAVTDPHVRALIHSAVDRWEQHI